jgi:hypothetical protein
MTSEEAQRASQAGLGTPCFHANLDEHHSLMSIVMTVISDNHRMIKTLFFGIISYYPSLRNFICIRSFHAIGFHTDEY